MESLGTLVDSSFFIAWAYLEQSGELGQADASAVVLLDAIEALVRTGERRRLVLANRAITAYREQAAESDVLPSQKDPRE